MEVYTVLEMCDDVIIITRLELQIIMIQWAGKGRLGTKSSRSFQLEGGIVFSAPLVEYIEKFQKVQGGYLEILTNIPEDHSLALL